MDHLLRRYLQPAADEAHDLQVGALAAAPDVVDLPGSSLLENGIQGSAVVVHVEPVPHILSSAIHRQSLARQGPDDHPGNKLLRELVGAVVVGAAAHRHGQAVGAAVGQGQQVGPRLGGAVWAAGQQGTVLGKEQIGAVQRQVAVDFVSGHLMKAHPAVSPAGIQQYLGAQHISLQKDARVLDRAVHMTLGGKVDDRVGPFLSQKSVHRLTVTDVPLHKAEAGMFQHRGQGGPVSRVGQPVQADHPVLRVVFDPVKDEVAPDESGSAGDQQRHAAPLLAISSPNHTPTGRFWQGEISLHRG